MKETTKQNLSIFLITVLLAGNIYIWFNYIKPRLDSVKKLKQDIEEIKKNINFLKEYQKKAGELVQSYSSLSQEISKIDLALPAETQVAQILAILNDISKNNGIILDFLSCDENTGEDLGFLTIHTSFTTTYNNLKNWLKEIEKELRLMDVQEISIRSITEGGSQSSQITKVTAKTTTRTTLPKSAESSVSFIEARIILRAYFLK